MGQIKFINCYYYYGREGVTDYRNHFIVFDRFRSSTYYTEMRRWLKRKYNKKNWNSICSTSIQFNRKDIAPKSYEFFHELIQINNVISSLIKCVIFSDWTEDSNCLIAIRAWTSHERYCIYYRGMWLQIFLRYLSWNIICQQCFPLRTKKTRLSW